MQRRDAMKRVPSYNQDREETKTDQKPNPKVLETVSVEDLEISIHTDGYAENNAKPVETSINKYDNK